MKILKRNQAGTLQQTKDSFVDSFANEMSRIPLVEKKDHTRSLRAIHLLVEYIRSCYSQDRSALSYKKIRKYSKHLIQMEQIPNESINKMIKEAELKVISEASQQMRNLNGLELAWSLKKSSFPQVREAAESLMNFCTSTHIRAISL